MIHTPIILPFNGVSPKIHQDAWIAPGAVVIGDVEIGAQSSVWFGCVVRGDVNTIRIGERTNIQDNSTIHVTRHSGPTTIGSGITIGHNAVLHACTLEDDCFVGMSSVILDGATVKSGGMLAAGAMLTGHKRIGAGQLWAGNPAKYFRDLKEKEAAFIAQSAANYVDDMRMHRGENVTREEETRPPW